MSRYLYYRIYTEDGVIDLKSTFSGQDKTLGRIDVSSIAPPHTVRSIKHRLAGQEGLINHDNIELYLRIEEDTAAKDSDHINLFKDDGYGSSPIHAIALVVPASSVPKGPKGINLSGTWHGWEIAGSARSEAEIILTMTSPTTFTGTAVTTDSFSDGTGNPYSYSYTVEDGNILANGQISWMSHSKYGKWKIEVTLASNGLVMSGKFSHVFGNVASGTSSYTRPASNA